VASEDEKRNFIEKVLHKDFTLLDDFEDILKSGKNLKNFFKEITNDIQKLAIKDLKSGLSIETYITILDIFQDILAKAKQSFDEAMTFKIGILKILNKNSILNPSSLQEEGATKNKEKTQPLFLEKGENSRESFEKVENKPQPKQEKNSLLEEVQDIFAPEKPFEDLGGQITPDQDFDVNKLIQ